MLCQLGFDWQSIRIEITAKHTGQKLDSIERDTDRDFYLSAAEAKEYGLIDEIIRTKK